MDDHIHTLLHEIKAQSAELHIKVNHIMATLADIQAAVSAQTTVEQSVVTLLQNLSAELKSAVASNDPVALQAVVDSIDANTKTLSDAVAANTSASANTPAQPTPAPTPAA